VVSTSRSASTYRFDSSRPTTSDKASVSVGRTVLAFLPVSCSDLEGHDWVPLLSSSARDYNAAGSESLGSFMSALQFMAPASLQVWREVERQWAGKSSLADVIRSKRQRS